MPKSLPPERIPQFSPVEMRFKAAIHAAVTKGVSAPDHPALSRTDMVAEAVGISNSLLQKWWSDQAGGRGEPVSQTAALIRATSEAMRAEDNPILRALGADIGVAFIQIPQIGRYETAKSVLGDYQKTKDSLDRILRHFIESIENDGRIDEQELDALKQLTYEACAEIIKLTYFAGKGAYDGKR